VSGSDPGGTLAKVASLVPVSSPLVMPPRLALGQASAVEVLAAVAILLLTIAAVIGFAARVYERAVMRTGKPVRLREALR
jgi:ABC-2 type transport system permease protein